jgi:hypothetical protein
MAKGVPEQYGSAEIPPLTGQEEVVLQAIYDHFRENGAWPTFITIDRPIRREHRWDTGAIILSLPESLIVQPCACRKHRPRHATRRYSLTRQAVRAYRRTRCWSRSTGSGRGFSGAAEFSDRWGRC